MGIEIFYKLIEILSPVFMLISLGTILSYTKVLNTTTNNGIQRYIFTTAMPIMLFTVISKYSIDEIFNMQYIVAILGIFFITLGLSTTIASKFFAQCDKSAFMHGLTATFSNSTYIGLAICYFAFGDAGFAPAVIYTVLTSFLLIIPILLCRYSEMQQAGIRQYKTLTKHFIWSFISNPLVIGPGLAIIFLLGDITLPTSINVTLDWIARTTAPMALISIGCSLYFIYTQTKQSDSKSQSSEIATVVIIKLIVSPLIAFLIIMPLDIDPIWKAVFVVQTAMPPGVSTYIICTQEKVFVRRNALVVLYSTVLSIITLSITIGFYL